MNREECIEAGIDPRHAGNPFLASWCWKLFGAVCLFGIVASLFGN
ncbi:MAG: hypothetical protein NTX72_06085 [Candidatus Uhrbacteria bacterium]|nr:hypothetical protein [Candidatus Uhrbacteria bacterium]